MSSKSNLLEAGWEPLRQAGLAGSFDGVFVNTELFAFWPNYALQGTD
ncbi:MAG: hypothetical protein JSV68_05205 [Anaerolineaceae bacterium]|nr:MAG: hypothetical protein JSV68_05205 [Anaerolineaceae bacterium]